MVQEAAARMEHTEEETESGKPCQHKQILLGIQRAKGRDRETLVERERSHWFLFFRWLMAFCFKSTVR